VGFGDGACYTDGFGYVEVWFGEFFKMKMVSSGGVKNETGR
jgi:hypothetical protein